MTKAARAVEIYQEEAALGADSLRKRCIARYKSELAMGEAGAGTYFQNTKKKLEGTNGSTPQLTLSVKPTLKSTTDAPELVETPSWVRYSVDANNVVEVVECYADQTAQLKALGIHGGLVSTKPEIINVGDSIN